MRSFRFKQCKVEQDGVAMKVGTDGVLLGAWADCSSASSILDIGTGTGLIALMVAQRSMAQRIVGIDVDAAAVECATANFAASPWAERLAAVECAAQKYDGEKFDLILSNPPYFVDSLHSPDGQRTVARHTTELTFETLDCSVCRLLADGGRFALILPTEQMEYYLSITKLNLARRWDVITVLGGETKRVIAELTADKVDVPTVESVVIENGARGDYNAQYRELTKDFYLKF